MDGQTRDDSIYRACIASRGKNVDANKRLLNVLQTSQEKTNILIVCVYDMIQKDRVIIKLAVSSGKRNVTIWRLSVRPSVCLPIPSFF